MKRSGFKKLSYDEAVEKAQKKRADKSVRQPSQAAVAGKRRSKKRKAANDRQHRIWQKKVRERDDYMCRWPGCGYRDVHIDVHHINERSQRPDLRYNVDNGACICGLGTANNHHDYLHHTIEGRKKAKKLGLLGGETYEKEKN